MPAAPLRSRIGPPPWRPTLSGLRALAPGALLCCVIALAAAFIEMRWGGSRMLFALVIGMAFHEFSAAPRQQPGVDFGAQTLLRLGIGLLGARITLSQLTALGAPSAALIVLAVASTLLLVAGSVRLARLPWHVGLIAGGATAICGASAALAIAAVLPRDRQTEGHTVAIVVAATTLSTVAMLSYPLLCSALGLPAPLAGLFLGGSIHDVAQVAVAGYALGGPTGDAAIVVKLMRVTLLTVVVVVVAAGWRHMNRQQRVADGTPPTGRASLMPWFMQLFVALMLLRTLQWLPDAAIRVASDLSQACLVVAAAALGMRSTVGLLRQAGWRLLLPMLIGSIWLGLVTLGGGWLLL